MAVIYLPQAIGGIGPSLNSLGALGGAWAGNKLNQNYTADVLAEAGKIQDPTAKAMFIMQKFPGREGQDLVTTLSQMQRTASETKKNEAETARADALRSLTQQQSGRYQHTADLEDKLQNARIAAENSLIAGRGDEHAQAVLKLKMLQDEYNRHQKIQPQIDALLSEGVAGMPPAARSLTPEDIQPPAGSPGPRSDSVPPAQRAGIAKQAADTVGLPPNLIHGLIDYETGGSWRTGITNQDTGAMGLAQALPSTAKDPGFGVGPFPARGTAAQQATWAAQYLKARGDAAGVTDWNDPAQQTIALAAYHGPQRDANGVDGETYAKDVLNRANTAQSPAAGSQPGKGSADTQQGGGAQGQGATSSSSQTPSTSALLATGDLNSPDVIPQLNAKLYNAGPLDTTQAQMQLGLAMRQAKAIELNAMATYDPRQQSALLEQANRLKDQAQTRFDRATAPKPGTKSTIELPGVPGVKATVAEFPDGKMRIMSVSDARKMMPNAEQLSDALSQWYTQTEAARSFNASGGVKAGDDSTLKRIERSVNQRLNDFGMAPIQFTSTDPAFNAEAATYGHNMIAAIAMTKGGGRGKAMTEMFQQLTPKPTDGPEVREAKVNASDLVVKVRVKNVVENAIAGGHRIPPSMKFIYDKYHLGETTLDTLQKGYVENAVRAGGNPIDPNDPQEGAIPISPEYRAAIEHPAARSAAPAATPANDGWTVKVVP